MKTITGFHAIEELIKANSDKKQKADDIKIFYSKLGPRVKKILNLAQNLGIFTEQKNDKELDSMVKNLPERLRDHRGLVLATSSESSEITMEILLTILAEKENATVVVLDSITDPHNIGSIVRSADQFGIDAIILPERNSAGSYEIIAKISSGASAWMPIVQVKNLVRAVETLKTNGFWVYGADANGENLTTLQFSAKTTLVMGSEGKGIAQHLKENCDKIVSIPTCGKLDSLNVSVAAGILMYEISKKNN